MQQVDDSSKSWLEDWTVPSVGPINRIFFNLSSFRVCLVSSVTPSITWRAPDRARERLYMDTLCYWHPRVVHIESLTGQDSCPVVKTPWSITQLWLPDTSLICLCRPASNLGSSNSKAVYMVYLVNFYAILPTRQRKWAFLNELIVRNWCEDGVDFPYWHASWYVGHKIGVSWTSLRPTHVLAIRPRKIRQFRFLITIPIRTPVTIL